MLENKRSLDEIIDSFTKDFLSQEVKDNFKDLRAKEKEFREELAEIKSRFLYYKSNESILERQKKWLKTWN